MKGFLFPGQGAQYPQMSCDLYRESGAVRQIFAQVSELYQRDLYRLLCEGDEQTLKQTEVTQVTITLANVSALTVLAERGVTAQVCAGFSLGEYSALYCAGVLSLNDTFGAVLVRCRAMERACSELQRQGSDPGMVAVLGLDSATIAQVIQPYAQVYLANLNGNSQTVIAGLQPGLGQAEKALLAAGAMKTVVLAVSGPFHTPLLAEAQAAVASFLEGVIFSNPRIQILSGVTGEFIRDSDQAKQLAAMQVVAPVQWVKVQQNLSDCGCDRLYEVGPGRVLAGLWRSHNRKVKVTPAGTVENMNDLEEGT